MIPSITISCLCPSYFENNCVGSHEVRETIRRNILHQIASQHNGFPTWENRVTTTDLRYSSHSFSYYLGEKPTFSIPGVSFSSKRWVWEWSQLWISSACSIRRSSVYKLTFFSAGEPYHCTNSISALGCQDNTICSINYKFFFHYKCCIFLIFSTLIYYGGQHTSSIISPYWVLKQNDLLWTKESCIYQVCRKEWWIVSKLCATVV